MIEQYTSPVAVNNSQEPWLVGDGVVVSGGVAIPSLDFNFITGGLPGTVTFTRASTATYFNSAGVLTSAAINEPRFDYNPATLAARGLLIEEQRTNSFTYSEDMTNAAWTKNNSTVTADSIASPNGGVNADKLVENTATGGHSVDRTFSVTSGTAYTYSIFVKAGERTAVRILLSVAGFGSNLTANYDISVGAWRTSSPTPSGGLTLTSQNVGNGWYRISASGTATATATATFRLSLLDSPSSTGSYTGDGVSGAYFWGVQLETAAFPTSYIPTVAAALTRSADVATVSPLTPWFNATEGTLYAQFDNAASGTRTIVAINDGTSNESIRLRSIGTNPYLTVTDGGIDQADIDAGTIAANTSYKLAGAYKTNDFAACISAGTVQTDTSGTLPTVTQMMLGTSAAANYLNGHLQRVTYYPRCLSNAELQSITA